MGALRHCEGVAPVARGASFVRSGMGDEREGGVGRHAAPSGALVYGRAVAINMALLTELAY